MIWAPSKRAFSGYRSRRACYGQASIEYLVILAFSVILLIKPFSYDDNGKTPEDSVIMHLANAIKDYHKSYTAAMAIAYIPDCDYNTTIDISKLPATITNSAGTSITVGADICIDWLNPQIPDVTVNGLTLGAFTGSIANIIKDTVTDAVDGFLHPDFVGVDGFLHPDFGSMLHFSSPF